MSGQNPSLTLAKQREHEADLAIIQPIHNRADHLRGMVDSYIQELTRVQAPCELLLVVNNSRDQSAAIARELAEAHSQVRDNSARTQADDAIWRQLKSSG